MMAFRFVSIVLASLLALGCVNRVPPDDKPVQLVVGTGAPDYRRYDLPAMAHYGGYVAGLSAFERVSECNKLISGAEGDINSLPIRFHIAFIMMLTAECGGPERALPIFASIRDQSLQNDLRSLVRYQVALANRFIEHADQSEVQLQQIARLKTKSASLNKRLKAKNNELEQLKATLDALKKIEKIFHQRNESDVR